MALQHPASSRSAQCKACHGRLGGQTCKYDRFQCYFQMLLGVQAQQQTQGGQSHLMRLSQNHADPCRCEMAIRHMYLALHSLGSIASIQEWVCRMHPWFSQHSFLWRMRIKAKELQDYLRWIYLDTVTRMPKEAGPEEATEAQRQREMLTP